MGSLIIPVSTASTPDVVADRIRGLIRAGDFSPGDRLPPERELAERLQIGRQALREALKALATEGYVVSRRGNGGGTFVADLTAIRDRWLAAMRADAADLHDILDLRVGLEARAAALAARRRTLSQLDAMKAAVEGLDAPDARTRFRQLDADFHRAVTAASASPRLTALVHQARGELFFLPDRAGFVEVLETTRDGHAAVLQAIIDQDEDAAVAAMGAHIETTRDEIEHVMGETS